MYFVYIQPNRWHKIEMSKAEREVYSDNVKYVLNKKSTPSAKCCQLCVTQCFYVKWSRKVSPKIFNDRITPAQFKSNYGRMDCANTRQTRKLSHIMEGEM